MAAEVPRLDQRASGLLVPLFSLPGDHGIGDLGPPARRFIEFLADSGQRWWQLLPIGPPRRGDSPYSSWSAFAGSSAYLSLDDLVDDGLLGRSELAGFRDDEPAVVGYAAVRHFKERRLRRAFRAFRSQASAEDQLATFERETPWLADWALFRALARKLGQSWLTWPAALRDRRAAAVREASAEFAAEVRYEVFLQYLFERQWCALREHAAARGVGLIGDVPLFVDHASADVWANRSLFALEPDGALRYKTGVPPDYFSETGQLWGHPSYRWSAHRRTGFDWWRARLGCELRRFDALRLDHFIGYVRAWRVDADARTAVDGRWVPGPGYDLFAAALASVDTPRLIAEDLGSLTPSVTALRSRLALPGLRLLQFAFGEDGSDDLDSWPRRAVAMTGTHDNDTVMGWYQTAPAAVRAAVRRRAGVRGRVTANDLLGLVYGSASEVAIVPLQDVLGLGSDARINTPGTPRGNWRHRFGPGTLARPVRERLLGWSSAHGRARSR